MIVNNIELGSPETTNKSTNQVKRDDNNNCNDY